MALNKGATMKYYQPLLNTDQLIAASVALQLEADRADKWAREGADRKYWRSRAKTYRAISKILIDCSSVDLPKDRRR
jgi:hypothetical protein